MSAETPSEDRHHVKRVVLPSGKTIEVVYFEGGDSGDVPRAVEAPDRIERELHICRECDSELVYPIEWEEASPECWRVTVRCPNCEWVASGVFAQDLVDRFDERLDQGTEQMVGDLKRLMHANMGEEIDRFVAALRADALLPEDF